MLVLTRKKGESIDIPSGEIQITVLSVKGSRVQIGISAPGDVRIVRTEVLDESVEAKTGLLTKAG